MAEIEWYLVWRDNAGTEQYLIMRNVGEALTWGPQAFVYVFNSQLNAEAAADTFGGVVEPCDIYGNVL